MCAIITLLAAGLCPFYNVLFAQQFPLMFVVLIVVTVGDVTVYRV